MKRFFYIPVAVVVLLTALAAGAQGQTSSAQRLVARIPFSFAVGKKTLPAGQYTVTVVNPSSDRKVLQIRSLDGRANAVIQTNGVIGNVTENAKLVFERYEDHYYFAQAQLAGDNTSLAAVRSKAEKNALASYKKKTLVVIAAG